MREERVLGHASLERRAERVDVVQAFTGEGAFTKEILIGIRYGGRVRIDAGVSRVHAREHRPRRAGHGHADARLQDAVALGDEPPHGIDLRPVERVKRDADERFRGIARQPRVAVERDAIADRRKHRQIADDVDEARVRGAAQEPVELFELAALPLPSHPALFALVPAALAMKEIEEVVPAARMPVVQGLHAGAGGRQDFAVARKIVRVGVGKIAEDGEVNVRVEIAQRLDFQMHQHLFDNRDAPEERRHDDHRPALLGNPGAQIEPRKAAGCQQPRQHMLHHRNRQLAGGHDGQDQHPHHGRRGCSARTAVLHDRGNRERREGSDGAEVHQRRVVQEHVRRPAQPPAPALGPRLEQSAPGPHQVIADMRRAAVRAGGLGLTRAFDAVERHPHLIFRGAAGQRLDDVAVLIARPEIHLAVDAGRIALQHLLDVADAFKEAAPVERRAEPQARDRIRHRDLVGGLSLAFDTDGVLRRHALGREPILELGPHRGGARAVLANVLKQPNDKRKRAVGRYRRRALGSRHVERPDADVGLGRLFAHAANALGEPGQVRDEGQLEHAGPGPELAHGERRHRLECADEPLQSFGVEPPVAVDDELPCEHLDPRRTDRPGGRHDRKPFVIASGEIGSDASGFVRDQVKVIQQPL